MPNSPLHEAVRISEDAAAIEVCSLLLQHKADPSVRDPAGRSPFEVLERAGRCAVLSALRAAAEQYQPSERPPRHCACNSGALFNTCHGAKAGVPVHPRMTCPCNGRSKQANTYARCCLKKGNRCWRLVKVMTTTNRAEAEMLLRHKEEVRREALARGADVEQQPLFPHMRAPGYGQQVMEWKREMMAERVREGSIEEAFAFAALRVDFECQPWRRDGVWAVSVEGEARCDEWNARVDEYMAAGRHGRAAFDVAKAAKISKMGGPAHAWCGNGGCAEEEQRACAFEVCGRCEISRCCSQECLAQGWKLHTLS